MEDDDDFIIINDDDGWERAEQNSSSGETAVFSEEHIATDQATSTARVTTQKTERQTSRVFTNSVKSKKIETVKPKEQLPGIIKNILSNAKQYDFFNVVSSIQRAHPEALDVGGRDLPNKEIIRFTPTLSLGFPGSEVSAVGVQEDKDGNSRFTISSNVMSIYGHASPIPAYYTEQLIAHERDDDNTIPRKFLDIFNHRILSLLYRSWQKYHAESDYRGDGSSAHAQRLLTMLGLDVPAAKQVGLPLTAMLGYAGLLTQSPRSAAALEAILQDWFKPLSVRVEQCTAMWTDIDRQDQCRLGKANSKLGEAAVLGDRSHNQLSAFTVCIGPLPREDFFGFLPEAKQRGMLEAILKLYNPDNLLCELELHIEGESLDEAALGPHGGRLGLTARLGNAKHEYHIRSRLKGMMNG